MPSSISNSDQLVPPRWDSERRLLKKFGLLLALTGFLAGVVASNVWWAWILDDGSFVPSTWRDWFDKRDVLAGLLCSTFPWFWSFIIEIDQRTYGRHGRWPVALIAVVVALAGSELITRSYPGQEFFWQAVKKRASGNYFTAEVATFRLSHNALERNKDERPTVVINGSSQMIFALDVPLLESLTGFRVHRAALAGLFIMENMAMLDFLDYPGASLYVTMRSGFDLQARDSLFLESMKPIATLSGVNQLFRLRDVEMILRERQVWADLWMSCFSEMWRSREYARVIMQNPIPRFDPASDRKTARTEDESEREVLAVNQLEPTSASNLNDRHLQYKEMVHIRLMEWLESRYPIRLFVEGRVNPAADWGELSSINERFRMLMRDQASKTGTVWIEQQQQGFDLKPGEWIDNTHIRAEAREKYTHYFADLVVRHAAP